MVACQEHGEGKGSSTAWSTAGEEGAQGWQKGSGFCTLLAFPIDQSHQEPEGEETKVMESLEIILHGHRASCRTQRVALKGRIKNNLHREVLSPQPSAALLPGSPSPCKVLTVWVDRKNR